MKKSLLKLICMALLTALCLGGNAQNLSEQPKTTLPLDFDAIKADNAPMCERMAATHGNPEKTLRISSYQKAYVGDYAKGEYSILNLATGEKTLVGTVESPPYPTGEDFDGTSIYRIHGSGGPGTIVKVAEDGATTPVGTVTGGTWVNTIGLAYDWLKDDGTWYFYNVGSPVPPYTITIYSFNMTTLEATQIGAPLENTSIMRGLTMANDGYLYAISIAKSALVKIDPTTGELTEVGDLGFSPLYGQDLAFDRVANILYAAPVDFRGDCMFGTLDMNTGAFTEIMNYGHGQHASFVICKSENYVNYCSEVAGVTAVQFKENTAKITWEEPYTTAGVTAYKIYDGNTEIAEVAANQNSYTTSALAAGEHIFAIEAIYGYDCTPQKVTTKLTIEICEAVEGVAVAYDSDCFATVSWNAAAKKSDDRGVLFNNGPIITHPGQGANGADASAIAVDNVANYGAKANYDIGAFIVDDFVLTTASTLESIDFYSYQSGSGTTSSINGVYLQIWKGDPTAGGDVVWGDLNTNRLISSQFSNIYRVNKSTLTNDSRPVMTVKAAVEVTLEPGTYWIEVAFSGSESYTGPWANPVSILGQNPNGNAMQHTPLGWISWVDSEDENAQYALPFIIYGNTVGSIVHKYNVYKEDLLVASEIEETSYTHTESVPRDIDIKWCVTQICQTGVESAPNCVTEQCETVPPPPCDPVTGATAEVGCKEATITWNPVAGVKGYKIMRDGVETAVTQPTFTETDEFVNGETYSWTIIIVCEENESDPVEVSAIANCESIREFAQTVSLYPNPAYGTVTITAENFAKVEVYSAIGLLVSTHNTPTVDVSTYPAGVYFFKVFDNNDNTAMKRISVVK